MSNSSSAQRKNSILYALIKIIAVLAVCVFFLKTCDDRQRYRDIEMMGRGMLIERGFEDDFPAGAGRTYFYMDTTNYSNEDYQRFYQRIRDFHNARMEMRRRGLSEREIRKISDVLLVNTLRGTSHYSLDELAQRYD